MADPSFIVCVCCSAAEGFHEHQILWPSLVAEWGLGPEEAALINRQQGLCCRICSSNLRTMALARVIMNRYGFRAGHFIDFVRSPRLKERPLSVLEINEAGMLTPFLRYMPKHTLVRYPESDMQALDFPDEHFDLVVHSDTLEHVPDPVKGLSECRRVLRPGGSCAYTVPLVAGRLSRRRDGLPPSYHGGAPGEQAPLVHTEYGADAWAQPFAAGFSELRMVSLEHPAAQAFLAVR